ncbi:hypothetical protein FGF1_10060 [Flavobacteriaceae bacterium GF1]
MKSLLPFLLFLLLFLLSCNRDLPTNKDISVARNALPLVLKKFNTAFANGDLAILDSLTTENYVHTNGSSKVISKTDWFNYLRQRNRQLKSGDLKVLDYSLKEQQIEYHGTTAIVTGKVLIVTGDSSGTKEHEYRITNIWVYGNEGWKRAGFHDGKIQRP